VFVINCLIIEKHIGLGGIDWIHLAQDRDEWRPRVNMITNMKC
jgi:hypothetical protein